MIVLGIETSCDETSVAIVKKKNRRLMGDVLSQTTLSQIEKQFGKGRVFYCSLGHSMDVFDIIEVKEILKRGLFWASESKFKPEEELLSPLYQN